MQSTGQLPYLFGLNITLTTSFHIFPAHQRSTFCQATHSTFVKQLLTKPRIYYWPNKSRLQNFLLLVNFQDLIERVKFNIHT